MYHLQGQRGDSPSHTKGYERISERGHHLPKADWSNEDPDITEALESYGRAGVPYTCSSAKAHLIQRFFLRF